MFKSRLVTGDGMWVYCYDPESKSKSMEWKARWITQNKEIKSDANHQKAYGHSILGRRWVDTYESSAKKNYCVWPIFRYFAFEAA